MKTDLFTDTPEVAALKAENKMLRQHLKECVRLISASHQPISAAFTAVDEMGAASIQADVYLRDLEASHDCAN
ncbi:hypothetical protein SAMN05216198_1517 [Halopseudomonas litoralis]|uniref:Uncharacterized protein n=1 Tax=Halopseudomonas litoralis TaxID=797277 RepID=A0A1H1QLJ1_9GAMM|nr:hypothetical protein [Halopseudomonas litoralis]SDS24207.1 hypothetical protein SAMN05216198_1517 [Halopseudomonas litoralis]